MSRDYADKEQEFLSQLKADTGRDLAAWMAVIASLGALPRNDIIDWLRQQGFAFARASWLERIHHNGGRPIYADALSEPEPRPRRTRGLKPSHGRGAGLAGSELAATGPVPAAVAADVQPGSRAAPLANASRPEFELLLAGAKALRPLALLVMREIEKAVPGVAMVPAAGAIVFQAPPDGSRQEPSAPFALLGLGPRELRLYLDLGTRPAEGNLARAKVQLADGETLSHMVVLDDARQIGSSIPIWVRESRDRVIKRT